MKISERNATVYRQGGAWAYARGIARDANPYRLAGNETVAELWHEGWVAAAWRATLEADKQDRARPANSDPIAFVPVS